MEGADPFVGEAFAYLALCIAIILLRMSIRVRQMGIRHLFADDWIMLLVLVPYTTETVLAYNVGATFKGLTNSGMTDAQRAAIDPDSEEFRLRTGGSKLQIAGWVVYTLTLWLVKGSLCTFYSRLTDGVSGYNIRIRLGYGILVATYIAILLVIMCSCQPFHHLWQISPNPGNVCQPAISTVYLIVPMVLNVLTDCYLIFIPVSMLWGAKIATYKKLSLCVLFSGALFVMAAGILRSSLILRDPDNGIAEASRWACRESFVAIITSNLPVIWGWLKPKLKPMFGSLLSSDQKPTNTALGADSFRLADKSGSGRWRNGHQTTTTIIRGGDEEDGSESSIKGIIPENAERSNASHAMANGLGIGITKDVTVTVSSSVGEHKQANESGDSLDDLDKQHGFRTDNAWGGPPQ